MLSHINQLMNLTKCGTLKLDAPIVKLQLENSINRALVNANILKVEHLVSKCACEILDLNGIGWEDMEKIIDRLMDVGLSLNPECRTTRE